MTNAWSWWEKSKATVFPACNSWLNFCVRGQFEINILIVRQKYTTYFTWTSHDTIKWYRSADTLSCNWSQHWCPICVHYQFSCALKLSRKYENEHWSWSSETMNSMSWHMSPQYGHMIVVSGYPVLTAVNCPFCEFPIYKMWTCKDTPDTPLPPFW